MYTQLAETGIICSEKTVLKLGFVMIMLAVFSGQSLPVNTFETGGNIIKGYVQENIILKEQDASALFLLKENWNKQLQKKYLNKTITKIEDGVIYVPIQKNINNKIEIIPKSASNTIHARAKIDNIVSKQNTLIAVNGTYFKQNTGTPLGALVINNEIISGPIYNRAGLIIADDGFKTARISFEGTLTSKNEIIKLDNINQPRMMFQEVLLYNSKWGASSPVTKKGSVHVAIKNNKIIQKSSTPIIIPYGGYVITAPEKVFHNLKEGQKIKLKYSIKPFHNNTEHIISGGPYLMKNGVIYIDTAQEKLTAIAGKNPRTAIGYTKDNVLIIVTVEGRKEGSSGVTLNELAKIMQDLDCYEAINLDGGSSTVMYMDGKVLSGTGNKNSAMVSNALIVRKKYL